MKKILIFAGTTEGRQLSDLLSGQKISHIVCVATQYGSDVMDKNPYADIRVGRMDRTQMLQFLTERGFAAQDTVVDATHPYAAEATRNIKEAAEAAGCEYIRVIRNFDETETSIGGIRYYQSLNECVRSLNSSCVTVSDTIPGTDSNIHSNNIPGSDSEAPSDGISGTGSETEPGKTCPVITGSISRDTQPPRILLTTGAKELHEYCSSINRALLASTYVRILPSSESLEVCRKAGISRSNIIAMQGPFSYELNRALLIQYGINHLITKNSGRSGGYEEKIKSALDLGVTVHVIERPVREKGLSVTDAYEKVLQIFGNVPSSILSPDKISTVPNLSNTTVTTKPYLSNSAVTAKQDLFSETTADMSNHTSSSMEVTSTSHSSDAAICTDKRSVEPHSPEDDASHGNTAVNNPGRTILLCGCGMGSPSQMTAAVQDAILNADAVFGSKRMLECADAVLSLAGKHELNERTVTERSTAEKHYDKYLAKDIIPILKAEPGIHTAVILFSGDSSFYSGARAAKQELVAWDNTADIRILPGISSVSYLAAKLGVSYDDACLYSLHGRLDEHTLNVFLCTVKYNVKTFVLLSGINDLNALGKELLSNNIKCRIYAGADLSYDTETIEVLSATEAAGYPGHAADPAHASSCPEPHTQAFANTSSYSGSHTEASAHGNISPGSLITALIINDGYRSYPESSRFFANKNCEYYPCHNGLDELNCLFCYCPLYEYPACPGSYTIKERDGKQIKSCLNCAFPHEERNYDIIMSLVREHSKRK